MLCKIHIDMVLKSLFFSPLDMWFRPAITGSPPPACQSSSLTRVDHHRAVLFGGLGKDDEPISPDVYILDMNHWVSLRSLLSLISIMYMYSCMHTLFIIVNVFNEILHFVQN